MNNRHILLTVVAAICCAAGLGFGFAFANGSSADFGTDDAIDRAIAVMRNPAPALGVLAAVEAPSTEQSLGENLLWGITLEELSATRERPLFSPSRRPPRAAVNSPPVKAVKAVTPVAPEPTFSLLGTVKGNGEGYALFIETTTHNIVRLKTGEGEDGWVLLSVREREAVLEKNDRAEVLKMSPITGVRK